MRIALSMRPDEMRPRRVRVDYRRSALLSDVICPHVAIDPDRTVVLLSDEDGGTYGVVELQ